jgi:hypothetical protein
MRRKLVPVKAEPFGESPRGRAEEAGHDDTLEKENTKMQMNNDRGCILERKF